MTAASDLTTVDAVKAQLGITGGNSDGALAAMITAASALIFNYCSRSNFGLNTITDLYDGYGNNWMLLRQWPVQSISSIVFDSTMITAAATGTPLSNGYYLEPILPAGGNQRLFLYDYWFPRGPGKVFITYTEGYASIPADVAQACIEVVGEMFNRRQRLGVTQNTLAGQQTSSYSQADLSNPVKLILSSYKRMLPV